MSLRITSCYLVGKYIRSGLMNSDGKTLVKMN